MHPTSVPGLRAIVRLFKTMISEPEMPAPREVDLSGTAPPAVTADGDAACSGCDAVVPFATMTIDERGYFCPGCARAR